MELEAKRGWKGQGYSQGPPWEPVKARTERAQIRGLQSKDAINGYGLTEEACRPYRDCVCSGARPMSEICEPGQMT